MAELSSENRSFSSEELVQSLSNTYPNVCLPTVIAITKHNAQPPKMKTRVRGRFRAMTRPVAKNTTARIGMLDRCWARNDDPMNIVQSVQSNHRSSRFVLLNAMRLAAMIMPRTRLFGLFVRP